MHFDDIYGDIFDSAAARRRQYWIITLMPPPARCLSSHARRRNGQLPGRFTWFICMGDDYAGDKFAAIFAGGRQFFYKRYNGSLKQFVSLLALVKHKASIYF